MLRAPALPDTAHIEAAVLGRCGIPSEGSSGLADLHAASSERSGVPGGARGVQSGRAAAASRDQG